MDYSRPELAERLAAGYVAGTLRGPARRRLEALLPAHPALRRAVVRWQDRLMPLAASVAPVPPPRAVWQRIEARIGGAPPAAAAAPWWARLGFWRALSAGAGVAVLALAVLLAQPPASLPPIVVVLEATTPVAGVVPASFVASISGDGRSMVTRPLVQVSLEANRTLELWAVPGAGAPRSLGLISERNATVVRRGHALQGAAALAVSVEPAGGSPTGVPTGPILYVGKLSI